ncbi:hypothetical protein CC2G_013396 [Coprinopsis cinerea AmutBmut pab1-1]|nr:hypothetical protein CC2G_013396 [Coprinopsis cinerea AmutBmut pab1-1]
MTDIGTAIQARTITVKGPRRRGASNTVSVVRLSPNGKLLASGDDAGYVTIRETSGPMNRIRIADAGASIRQLLWDPHHERALLIGATNGYVNYLELSGSGNDMLDDADYNTAVKVQGFVTALALNRQGNLLAIGVDNRVQLSAYPFPSDVVEEVQGPFLPIRPFVKGNPKKIPLRDRTIARQIFFLKDNLILVVFLGGAQAFELKHGSWLHAWTMPRTSNGLMGSAAVSPSGTALVVSNLTTGFDWYSIPAQKYQMTTYLNLGYKNRNVVTEVAFLDESTIVGGSNLGLLPIARNGNVAVIDILGTEERSPSQSVSVARSGSSVIIASSLGTGTSLWSLQSRLDSDLPTDDMRKGKGRPRRGRWSGVTDGESIREERSKERDDRDEEERTVEELRRFEAQVKWEEEERLRQEEEEERRKRQEAEEREEHRRRREEEEDRRRREEEEDRRRQEAEARRRLEEKKWLKDLDEERRREEDNQRRIALEIMENERLSIQQERRELEEQWLKLDQEKQARSAMERENSERERERLERERAEAERVERENAERERAEAERVERENAERERERLERESAEAERVERENAERERERLERESAEAERVERERERLERENAERERERLERERAEEARLERENAEKARKKSMEDHVKQVKKEPQGDTGGFKQESEAGTIQQAGKWIIDHVVNYMPKDRYHKILFSLVPLISVILLVLSQSGSPSSPKLPLTTDVVIPPSQQSIISPLHDHQGNGFGGEWNVEEEEGEEEEEEEEEEGAGDDEEPFQQPAPHPPMVITETKVVTVTRAVTKTVFFTRTITATVTQTPTPKMKANAPLTSKKKPGRTGAPRKP